MTVKLNDNISLSASRRKKDPAKYRWFTMAKGKAHFESHHDEFDLTLSKGENFGLKFYRGSYFLIDEDDLTIQFKLSVAEAKKLMKNVKPFAGSKIGGKAVKPGNAQAVAQGKSAAHEDEAPARKAPAKKAPAKKAPAKGGASGPTSRNVVNFLSKNHGLEMEKDPEERGVHTGKTTPAGAKAIKAELESNGWTEKPKSNTRITVGSKRKKVHPSVVMQSPDGKREVFLGSKGPKTLNGNVSVRGAPKAPAKSKPKPRLSADSRRSPSGMTARKEARLESELADTNDAIKKLRRQIKSKGENPATKRRLGSLEDKKADLERKLDGE